jgi:hypothetical protein
MGSIPVFFSDTYPGSGGEVWRALIIALQKPPEGNDERPIWV